METHGNPVPTIVIPAQSRRDLSRNPFQTVRRRRSTSSSRIANNSQLITNPRLAAPEVPALRGEGSACHNHHPETPNPHTKLSHQRKAPSSGFADGGVRTTHNDNTLPKPKHHPPSFPRRWESRLAQTRTKYNNNKILFSQSSNNQPNGTPAST